MDKIIKYRTVLIVLFIWLIFSMLYIYAAYNKPFHADEYYSWVYAERCTYSEIMHLRDGGIGHPPLYHLALKTVQSFIKPFHFLSIRLPNYLFGSMFVVALGALLSRIRCHPFFIVASCLSATVIDCFIFSRMWGLVGLFAVLLVSTGEQFDREGGKGRLVVLIALCLSGFCADYAFILMMPYMAILLLSDRKFFNKLLFAGFSFSIVFFVLFNMYMVIRKMSGGYYDFIYHLLREMKNALEEMMVLLFDFNYFELFAAAVLVFAILVISAAIAAYRMANDGNPKSESPVRHAWRGLWNFVLGSSYVKSVDRRLVLSITCAMVILLVVNPFMWRDLLSKRFLFALYPMLLLLIARNLDVKRLHIMSAFMLLGLALYLPSNKVLNYYPPPAVQEEGSAVLFHDDISYSTHYLKVDYGRNVVPVIFDFTKYDMYCRICRMGTPEFPFNKHREIRIVGRENFNPDGIIPREYHLVNTQPYLSGLDRLLNNRLTPMYPRYFSVYTYRRMQ